MKRMRLFSYFLFLIFVFACVSLSGCAMGTSYVKLDYSPTPLGGKEIAGKNIVLVGKAVDKRAGFLEEKDYTGDQVGFKRNSYGGVTGSVRLQGGEKIQDSITTAIGRLIESRGFKARPSDGGGPESSDETKKQTLALLRTEIVQFDVGFIPRFVDIKAFGDAELKMSLIDPDKGLTFWEEKILVNYEKGGIMAFTDDDYQEAAETTLRMLMTEMEKKFPWEKLEERALK